MDKLQKKEVRADINNFGKFYKAVYSQSMETSYVLWFLSLFITLEILGFLRKNIPEINNNFLLELFASIIVCYGIFGVAREVVNLLFPPIFSPGKGYFLLGRTISMDTKGIKESSEISEVLQPWDKIAAILSTPKYILIYRDDFQGYVMPLSNFESREQAEAFLHNALNYWNSSRNSKKTK